METRNYADSRFEIRQLESEGRKIFATVIPWNSDSRLLRERGQTFIERFAAGSTTETISSGDITAVLDHDDAKHLASQAARTLKLFEDSIGLHAEFSLPDTSYVRDFLALQGEYRGMSFQFAPAANGQSWGTRADGTKERTITRAHLAHVSPVITPAYPQTSFDLRQLDKDIRRPRWAQAELQASRILL